MPGQYEKKTLPLADLPPGAQAEIVSLNVSGRIKHRLLDLGFIPGTKIEASFSSPLGDPKAYKIRETLLGLRAQEAKFIAVRRLIS